MLTAERPVPAGTSAAVQAPDSARRWFRRRPGDAVVVSGLLVLALALRIPTINRYYWIDESISIGIASHPLGQIPALLRLDGSPPLWYYLLHFWMLAFGSSPAATHTLSLLWSLAVIPLAYWSGRRLFNRGGALCAAALAATNPFLNWYATESRMYTLVVFIALAAVTLMAIALRDRSRWHGLGAAVTFAALCYTHNWGLYLTAAAGLYAMWWAWHRRDRNLAIWAAGFGALTVLLFAPWIPSLFYQAANTAAPWAVAPQVTDFFADPTTAIGGTAGIVVAPTLLFAAWWTRHRGLRQPSVTAAFLVATALGATIAGWVGAQAEPSWTVRYLAVTVAPWLLAAAGVLGSSRFGRRTIAAVCALLSLWGLIGAWTPLGNGVGDAIAVVTGSNPLADPHPLDAKDNAASIATAAAPFLKRGDLVIVTQTEQTPVLAHYLSSDLTFLNPMGPVSDPYVVNWRHIVARLQAAQACSALGPSIAKLPVGGHILEVDPLYPIGTEGSAWYRAAHAQVEQDERYLTNDPQLQTDLVSFREGISPKPYSPVIGQLFTKVSNTAAAPACP